MAHKSHLRPTRRAALLGLLSATAIASPYLIAPSIPAEADFNLELGPPLRSHTRQSGIRYGCAGAAPNVQSDRILLEKFAIEANIFVPEGALKWATTEPKPGKFDFSQGDSMAEFAARNGMLVHGHTLVWSAALPQWASDLTTAKEARAALERHISTQVSRYRGMIWAWDVVNEAIEPGDRLENGYRNSVWLRCLGIDYVDLAFRLARDADPITPLTINDYEIEYDTPSSRSRRQALLGLLQKLRDRNTPIDCLALQSHLDASENFDRRELTAFLHSVIGLGYRLMITELDVNDYNIPGSDAERDVVIARHLDEYLDIIFSVAKPASIATWGLSDRYTWMRQFYKRQDGLQLRPLPLDTNLNRKRMWAVLARYLAA